MRFKLIAAALAASGLAAFAASTPALAAGTVNGPFWNIGEAGYQIQSSVPFNEVRTTITIPAGSTTTSFVALVPTVNGDGQVYAIGLYFSGPSGQPATGISAGCPTPNSYCLESLPAFTAPGGSQTGVPVANPTVVNPHLVSLSTLGAPAGHPLFSSAMGGSYYVEAHYSTSRHLVQFVAGPNENDAATLAGSWAFFKTFNAPAVETWNSSGLTLPVSTPQASFSRTGVTEPAGHNVGGIAGTRITFDFFATDEAEASSDGNAPTIGTHATLFPSPALPGVGSAFGVVTGS
jgi:hypothetical protein